MVEETEIGATALGARNKHQGTGCSERIIEVERTHLGGAPGGCARAQYNYADATTPAKGLHFGGRVIGADAVMKSFPTWIGVKMIGYLKQFGCVGAREPNAYREDEKQAAFHKLRVRSIQLKKRFVSPAQKAGHGF